MEINLKSLPGPWDSGYALDRHKISSTFIGYNDAGYPQFDTLRTDVGESLFQLKYRQDWSQAEPLAKAVADHVLPSLGQVGLIIPMAASNVRTRQPVNEVCSALGQVANLPVFENLLVATAGPHPSLKNLNSKEEKVAALAGRFTLSEQISNDGRWNAILVDDLFDSGASMEAACAVLRSYPKIAKIHVVALTWK